MPERSSGLSKSNRINPTTSAAVMLLKRLYFAKVERNPSYSLRAFSKASGVSHTLLSLIFTGKRALTPMMANKIADRLDLNPNERRILAGEKLKKTSSETEENLQQIDLDTFALLAEWQHYAILSLLEVEGFKMDHGWIAKRLGLPELLARESIERLLRLGMIEQDSKGKWRQKGGYIRFHNQKSTQATRRFQKQLMKKALQSLEEDPFEIRNHSAMTFAMDPKSIPMAIERIKEFRYELSRELENLGNKKEVYNLTVQLFPVSRSDS